MRLGLGVKFSTLVLVLAPYKLLISACPVLTKGVDTELPVPTISAVSEGDERISGKVLVNGKPPKGGFVEVCVDGKGPGAKSPVTPDGSFSADPQIALVAAQKISAQYISDDTNANPGPPSSGIAVAPKTLPACPIRTKGVDTELPVPKVNAVNEGDKFISGKVLVNGKLPQGGFVEVCVDGKGPGAKSPVTADGSFSADPQMPLVAAQKISAQYISGDTDADPGAPSSGIAVASKTQTAPATSKPAIPMGMAAMGVDMAGASSTSPQAVYLANALADVQIRGKDLSPGGLWLSGLLRVAGMAQPGTLPTNLSDLASTGSYLAKAVNATPDKIVQSLEAGASAAVQLWSVPNDGWVKTVSFLASVGAMTPLSASQANPPVYYLTQQITNTYTGINSSGCNFGSGTTPPTCYVSFVPSDRSHFYRNYSAGFRFKLYGPADSDDSKAGQRYNFPLIIDATLGQNEYVTGGSLHGSVLHAGGVSPIPGITGAYVFGSMDLGMSFGGTQNSPQLLLTPVPSNSNLTYLSSNVNIISVSQPNRDRYRLGFGIDIVHLISSLKKPSAPSSGGGQ